ncbi:hypothetical protein AJ87_29390 [Rhizobium yanglingense]|nr:hypothetical protein AJ87_29390 [Rhizobium yanglingense]
MHERIEGLHGFFERRLAVPFVKLIEIDDIGLQALEACLAGRDQVLARRARIVRAVAHREARLSRDQHAVLALAAEDFAKNFLRDAGRIDIGGVDQVDARIEAQIDKAAGFGNAEIADHLRPALAAEGHRAHRHGRNLEARAAK